MVKLEGTAYEFIDGLDVNFDGADTGFNDGNLGKIIEFGEVDEKSVVGVNDIDSFRRTKATGLNVWWMEGAKLCGQLGETLLGVEGVEVLDE